MKQITDNWLKSLEDEIITLRAENERLRQWASDLQSGMYVNCVYCGHRYGPGETTPVSMADALKAHVETCPKHPMSALKAENARLRAELEAASDSECDKCRLKLRSEAWKYYRYPCSECRRRTKDHFAEAEALAAMKEDA